MRILILGGTRFVGRAIAEECLKQGHEITLLHRGQSGADLFPTSLHVYADRDGELGKLPPERWDAVIDTSGYLPRVVAQSVSLFSSTPTYLFISTISVYRDEAKIGLSETDDVQVLGDPSTETVDGETYGGLKALCEAEVAKFAGNHVIVRPGLVVGPNDHTDRFSYWPMRASDGDYLVPEDHNARMQFIDVRDLAAFCVKCLALKDSITVNAVGPENPLTWTEFTETLSKVCGGKPVWAEIAWLREQGVLPWVDLPLWIESSGAVGMSHVSNAKAKSLGLAFRPLIKTIEDTILWLREAGKSDLKTGMSRERHAQLLVELTTRSK